MRKLIAPLVIAGLLGPAVAPAVAGAAIKVGDNYFVRPSGVPIVNVDKGTKVTWKCPRARACTTCRSARARRRSGSPTKSSGSYTKKLTKAGHLHAHLHGARRVAIRR